MRFKNLMIIGVLLYGVPFSAQASVLLPEDTTTQQDRGPNLGLVPRQTTTAPSPRAAPNPAPPAATQQAPTVPAPASAQAIPDTAQAFDSVDTKAVQSIDISILRNSMPEEFKGVSDSDIRKLIDIQLSTSKDSATKKYLKTDSQTGRVYVDFDQMKKDNEAAKVQVNFVPGGKVTTAKTTAEQDKEAANLLAKGKIPPTVGGTRKMKFMQKEPMILTSQDLPMYDNGILKNTLSVSIPKDYTWGLKDTQKIKNDLGYTEDLIPTNCQLRLDTTLRTDDELNLYGATIMSGNSQRIPYNGVLKTVKARPYAVCKKPSGALPLSGSIIFSYGDKYAIMLSESNCSVSGNSKQSTSKPPSSAVIQYSGDSKVTCTFVN